jgi:hypothetical protein
MVAGVAMASAGVIAVSPVTPPMPNIQDVQERVSQAVVQLTATANPLVVWQQTIATSLTNLQALATGSQGAFGALGQQLATGAIFQEIANVLVLNTLNPGPLLDQILNFHTRFGPTIELALNDTFTRLGDAAEQLPGVLQESLTYLSQGQFVEAFSKINGWFVLRVLGGIRPLIPILSIPAQFVGGLPGVDRLDNLLDVVSEFALTKAIFEPFVGAALQTAEIFDAARIALTAGDFGTAVSELVNLPARVADALLNGITPAGTTTQWQGLIRGGLGTYLMVTLPNQIAAALTPPAPVVNNALAEGGPNAFSFGGDTFTISTGPEGGGSVGGIDDQEGDIQDPEAKAEAEAEAAAAAAAEAEAKAKAEAETAAAEAAAKAEADATAAAEAEAAAKAEAEAAAAEAAAKAEAEAAAAEAAAKAEADATAAAEAEAKAKAEAEAAAEDAENEDNTEKEDKPAEGDDA